MIFVDNDITFPPWMVRKFVDTGRDLVTAACPKRDFDWRKIVAFVGQGVTAEQLNSGIGATVNFDYLPGDDDQDMPPSRRALSSVPRLLPPQQPRAHRPCPSLLRRRADLDRTKELGLPEGFYVSQTTPDSQGWLEIKRAGTGFLMLSRQLLLDMVHAYPDLVLHHPKHG